MEKTTLQLFELNQRTLAQWHNKRQKGQEQAVLLQGVQPPSASAVDPEPQPQPRPLLREAPTYAHLQYVFLSPPNAVGLAKQRNHPGAAVRTIAPALAPLVIPVPHAPALPSTSSAAAAAAAPPPPPRLVQRTTSWRHKKRAEEQEEGSKRKYERKRAENMCGLCGQRKRKEFGLSRFGNTSFCSASSGKTVAQWLAEMRAGKL
ncbi:uncharacterized protein LOC121317806 [Polyodon spathula]|uniref:uncharacterized protein LOC121317806 n=1 Tax=Polyodon spathula TaxID=7913 RepID=UPI001B7E08E4|nr:uncharacterized protein LOC121317806 [Polyodon spathula]